MITVPDHGNYRNASKPRSIVRLDGNNVFFNSWSVNLNSTDQADDFSVVLPFRIVRNQPQAYLLNSPDHPSYLLQKSNVLVEIFVGYPSDPDRFQTSDLTRIMYGYVDTVEIDLSSTGESVTLTGRNMVAPFVDNKIMIKYQNMTASAIAQQIATNRGLTAQVTPTYTVAGKYTNDDSAEISDDSSEWDLLTYLAEQEGYSMRVQDNTLLFGTYDQVVGNLTNADPLPYTWGQNVVDLQLTRSPHAVKTVVVEVHSYDTQKAVHLKQTAQATYANATDTYTERYFFPGLTASQAQQKADSLLAALTRVEMTGTIDVSGNEQLQVNRKIALYGVGLAMSDTYYILQATHNFDFSSGYMTQVTFSNLFKEEEDD